MTSAPIESARESAAFAFLHRLDSVAGEAAVVQTTRHHLRAASFLDGREQFWQSLEVEQVALGEAHGDPANRFVFHVGFCGSTLLARMLDASGPTLALKEPQCLVDLTDQWRQIAAHQATAPASALLDYALGRLGAVAGDDLELVIKPSNWANPLVPAICDPGRGTRAVFVSMDPRAFLGAVFRGGRDRLAFCTRLAAAIASTTPAAADLLRDAIDGAGDPLDRAARITALLHTLQISLFRRAIAANGWSDEVWVDFTDLTTAPAATLDRVRAILQLAPAEEIAGGPSAVMARHAKDPANAFAPDERRRADEEIERHHGDRFDAALAWVEQAGVRLP